MEQKNSGNHKGQGKSNQKNDRQNDILSGIRRVSADSKLSGSSNQSPVRKERPLKQSTSENGKTDKYPRKSTLQKPSAQPIAKKEQRESSKAIPDANGKKLTSAGSVSNGRDSDIRQALPTPKRISVQDKKKDYRKRRIIATIFVVSMMLIIITFVCVGAYHFYRFLSRKNFNQPESMLNSMLEVTYETTTEKTTTRGDF